jgi:dephospho-CoA kinase
MCCRPRPHRRHFSLMQASQPLVVAVTGGVASGKSELTRRFEALGAPVIDADLIARELVLPGLPALAEIVERFGASMLNAAGELDRAALRARVFSHPAEREALEAILHPRVRQAMRERAQAAAAPYVLLAIPLLVESGHYDWVHRVLVVDTPKQVQIARVMARDGIDHEAAQRMLAAQASRQARLARASDVVVNDGPVEALDAAVQRLDRWYRMSPST